MIKDINIDGRLIGQEHPTYFVADIAANHDGDIERAKDLIYKAAEAGADAAKFQHFQAKTIVSDLGFQQLGNQKSHQSNWKKSVFEVYNDASVDWEWTAELCATCKKAGIPFFTTPYSLEVVDFINDYVPAYKIGSGDITWSNLISKVARQNKPLLLAAGASTMDEIIEAVDVAYDINSELVLMQCNTNYTGSLDNFKYINLNVLKTFRSTFPKLILGLSDHTPGHSTVLGAVSLGARVIEKHFTDDVTREGPDHAFSMDPESWAEMVFRTRELELSLGTGLKKIEANEKETVIVQRRSLRLNSDMSLGSKIKLDDIKALRPCPIDALPPNKFSLVKNLKLNKNKKSGDYLKLSDFS